MAKQTFTVDVTGLDELKAKLQSKRLFGPVKQEIIKHASTRGRQVAEDNSKGRHGTKGFKGRMVVDFEQEGLVARLHPHRAVMGIAATVNRGRRAGNVALKGFVAWAQHAGIPVYRSEGRRRYTSEFTSIREAVRLVGTKGVHFMEDAEKEANEAVRDGLPRAERAIEQEWNR